MLGNDIRSPWALPASAIRALSVPMLTHIRQDHVAFTPTCLPGRPTKAVVLISQEIRPHHQASNQQTGTECEAHSLSPKERHARKLETQANFVPQPLPTSPGRFCPSLGPPSTQGSWTVMLYPPALCNDTRGSEKIERNETLVSQKDTSPHSEPASGQDILWNGLLMSQPPFLPSKCQQIWSHSHPSSAPSSKLAHGRHSLFTQRWVSTYQCRHCPDLFNPDISLRRHTLLFQLYNWVTESLKQLAQEPTVTTEQGLKLSQLQNSLA